MRSTIILMLFSEVRGLFAARTRSLRISRADKKLHGKYGVFKLYLFSGLCYTTHLHGASYYF